ncbi:sulfur transferase domain-containing protein [Marinobacteraceae bacterium S3BR75-40.1]
MANQRFKRAALPVAITLAMGLGLAACSDSQQATSTSQSQTAAANPCAAAKPQSGNPSAMSNPCAAANPCAAGQASANPCAASGSAMASGDSKASAPNAPAQARGDRHLPFAIEKNWTTAPYGDAMPAIVDNYNRPAPYIASGGLIKEGALPQLKELGFKTVVTLMTEEEGAGEEEKAAHGAGINYYKLGVSTKAPTWEQVEAFTRIASSPENYPILVHCHSANRVGAMWALYRFHLGVPAELALEEGRAAGLKTSREGAVKEMMGL